MTNIVPLHPKLIHRTQGLHKKADSLDEREKII